MQTPNFGTKAATRQSWQRHINIRVYIKEIQDEHPGIGEKKLIQLLVERMHEEEDVLIAAAEYAVRAALNAQEGYIREESERTAASPMSPIQRAERKEKIEQLAKEAVAQILYLNEVMPNGKRMRFCPGDYIAKLGGAYAKAGKKAGPKLMGQVFDEESFRQLTGLE